MIKKLLTIIPLLIIILSALITYKYINTGNVAINNTIEKKEKVISLTKYEDIIKYINSDGTHMIVLGKTGCSYCEKYQKVLKQAVEDYSFQYAYIDASKLSKNDFNLLFNSDITIPGKCRDNNQDAKLSDGFNTPLTIFIENKSSYDCIRGFVDLTSLINALKSNTYID